MADTDKTQVKPTPKSEADDSKIKSLSAPATVRIHARLATAQEKLSLDKASLVRLAVRLMIKQFYAGNGQWTFPSESDIDFLAAGNSERCDIGLKK